MNGSGIARDAWLAAIADVGLVAPDLDETALTIHDCMRLFRLGRTASQRRLDALVKAGRAQRCHKHIVDLAGRTLVVPAYRLVTPPAVTPRKSRGRR